MASKQFSLTTTDLIILLGGYSAMLGGAVNAHMNGAPMPDPKQITERMDEIAAEIRLQHAAAGNKQAA